MSKTLIARASVVIDAPAHRVWDALTRPEIIKKYFFGTETITDWKIGGPIQFTGEYNGKYYSDKGTVTAFEPYSFIQYKYWSSLSGTPDIPENYLTISYFIMEVDGKTKLEISQENVRDLMAKEHSEDNWRKVLANLKRVVEDSSKVLAF